MKFVRKVLLLLTLGLTSLFASDLGTISLLVDKINNTNDLEKRLELMETLDRELKIMNNNDFAEIQKIVNIKLKQSSVDNN